MIVDSARRPLPQSILLVDAVRPRIIEHRSRQLLVWATTCLLRYSGTTAFLSDDLECVLTEKERHVRDCMLVLAACAAHDRSEAVELGLVDGTVQKDDVRIKKLETAALAAVAEIGMIVHAFCEAEQTMGAVYCISLHFVLLLPIDTALARQRAASAMHRSLSVVKMWREATDVTVSLEMLVAVVHLRAMAKWVINGFFADFVPPSSFAGCDVADMYKDLTGDFCPPPLTTMLDLEYGMQKMLGSLRAAMLHHYRVTGVLDLVAIKDVMSPEDLEHAFNFCKQLTSMHPYDLRAAATRSAKVRSKEMMGTHWPPLTIFTLFALLQLASGLEAEGMATAELLYHAAFRDQAAQINYAPCVATYLVFLVSAFTRDAARLPWARECVNAMQRVYPFAPAYQEAIRASAQLVAAAETKAIAAAVAAAQTAHVAAVLRATPVDGSAPASSSPVPQHAHAVRRIDPPVSFAADQAIIDVFPGSSALSPPFVDTTSSSNSGTGTPQAAPSDATIVFVSSEYDSAAEQQQQRRQQLGKVQEEEEK